MELRLHSHRWDARAPDWTAAVVSGFVAGALLMVMELLWNTNLMGSTPWTMPHMIAAMVEGSNALQSNGFSFAVVALALAIHYLLGIVFGVVLAAIIAPFHLDSSLGLVLLTGAIFGAALYLFNFYGMVRFFPWFEDIRGGITLLAHLIFGMAAAWLYQYLEVQAAIR